MTQNPSQTTDGFDLITMGRVGVDLYPGQIETPLEEVEFFNRYLGGTATNVAVAAARYGRRSAVITKVGDDPFGKYVKNALRGFGVSDGFVGVHPTLRTPLVFCEVWPPDNFPLLFYREPTAPDLTISRDELDEDALAAAQIVWTTGTGLSIEPSRSATLAAQEMARSTTIHDLDYRPMFWSDPTEARPHQQKALRRATVAIGNVEECAVAVGGGTPPEQAKRMMELGVEIAVVKQGPNGVSVFTADVHHDIPAVEVEVVNGLGAGDAFGGAFCHGLLAGWDLDEVTRFANAAGAYVAGELACADAMPVESQVRDLLTATDEG